MAGSPLKARRILAKYRGSWEITGLGLNAGKAASRGFKTRANGVRINAATLENAGSTPARWPRLGKEKRRIENRRWPTGRDLRVQGARMHLKSASFFHLCRLTCMKQEIVITVDEQGTTTHLVDHPLTEFPESATVARASHIEPVDPFLYIAFRLIRALFGDDSKAADWTRTWDCEWGVDLTPVGGPNDRWFSNRQMAIDYEIKWLNKEFLK